jgi:mono/diheme cytochrome c family protein
VTVRVVALAVVASPLVLALPGRADEALTNPVLGQPQAIEQGEGLYRSHCIGCHGRAGGRGPNLFETTLSDRQFMETVINGRKGTQMPAWGLRLSPDEVWALEAYVKSRKSAW